VAATHVDTSILGRPKYVINEKNKFFIDLKSNVKKYGIIDPNEAIIAQIARYNSNIVTHPWAIILRQ